MTVHNRQRVVLWFVLVICPVAATACGPSLPVLDGADEVGGSTSSGDGSDDGFIPTDSDSDSGSDSDSDSSGSGSGTFIPEDDGGDIGPCDAFAQDCPEGEKCVPYSLDGDTIPDSSKCVPVQGEAAPGSPCTRSDWVESADDCDGSSVCFAGADGGPGLCRALCQGVAQDPQCGLGYSCVSAVAAPLTLCVANCDVLLQDCPDGEGCYHLGDPGCAPLHRLNGIMKPCEQFNDCAPGLFCAPTIMAPDCTGDACCLPYCDLNQPDCAALPGSVCTSLLEEGTYPPGINPPGVCMSPEGMLP